MWRKNTQDKEPRKSLFNKFFNKFKELWALCILFTSVFLFLSFFTYHSKDLSNFSNSHHPVILHNFFGITGACIAHYLLMFIGLGGYLISVFFFFWALRSLFVGFKAGWIRAYIKIMLFLLILVSFCTLTHLIDPYIPENVKMPVSYPYLGGIVGKFVTEKFANIYLGYYGAIVICSFLLISATIIITDGRPLSLIRWTTYKLFQIFIIFYNSMITIVTFFHDELKHTLFRKESPRPVTEKKQVEKKRAVPPTFTEPDFEPEPVHHTQDYPETKITTHEDDISEHAPRQLQIFSESKYEFPPVDLLEMPEQPKETDVMSSLKSKAELLRRTLLEFGIEVNVSEITRGPVITQYELTLAPGTKVQRIIALENDIALAMKTPNIRIVAPIPGKSAVGIEVPNDIKSLVSLRELLSSKEFINTKSSLPLILGKDITGRPIISDLASAPHLLIAGATGSGKSVCINALVVSLLYSCTPNQLKFMMVDPKKVELVQYNDLPHMITPVITDTKKVSAGLNWVVHEMEKRYEILAEAGVRNIKSFNQLPKDRRLELTDEKYVCDGIMPYIIVILDELADLMIVAQDEIEDAITRLAQLSRAVGIHLILATQRPSVNVITGVIKANFPVRISFKVSSKVDSRTVLDANGAEVLLGNGDFLFLPPGSAKLIRGQGTYVSDNEIHSIVTHIKNQCSTDEDNSFDIFEQDEMFVSREEEIDDELYEQAVEVVKLTQQASASILQRKLRVGYARAARLIDIMEANGIVGPHRGSKPREILVE